MSDYKISFVSVSLGRRITYNEYVGIRGTFMPVKMFIAACAIISKHPEDFPCLEIVSRNSDSVITSNVVFQAYRI